MIAVIASGEETGKLPESLAHLADDYDEQSLGHGREPRAPGPAARDRGPGAIVLFIILAVFLPIIQMITSLASPG